MPAELFKINLAMAATSAGAGHVVKNRIWVAKD